MNTQVRPILTPPPTVPPTRNAGGFASPDEPHRVPSTWWHDVASEVRRVRWLKWSDVAARSAVLMGVLSFFTVFVAALGALARAVVNV